MKDYRSILKLFVIATAVALFARLFVIEDFRIASSSMLPNLKPGKLIFVSKSAFSLHLPFSSYEVIKFSSPKPSEIVAFNLPEKRNVTFVKRVVALAGDRVEIKSGELYINGNLAKYEVPSTGDRQLASTQTVIQLEKLPLEQSESYKIQLNKEKIVNYGPIDIPPNHFFALGDNRSESVDSRVWGPVPYSCLKGRIVAIF